MALKVETGSGIAGANSYGVTDEATTIAAARAYAADRGTALSNDDAVVSQQLINATDYLETKSYVGVPAKYDQPLSFPRSGLNYTDGTTFPSDKLPDNLLKALYQLCIEQKNGIKLLPSVSNAGKGFVTRKKIDVLEWEYSEKIGTTSAPMMPAVDALLAGLLVGMPALRNVRG